MRAQTEKFTPDYIIPPGEILEETLDARGIKKKEFAERCGKTAKTISEIIAGKAPITPETALQFERVLGVSARLWSNLESSYRLKLAEQEDKRNLLTYKNISKHFPVKELVKYGFIEKPNDAADELSKLLSFFGVATTEALDYWSNVQVAHYRHSKSFSSDKSSIATWLRCGHIKADQINTRPYDHDKFKSALYEIRSLTRECDIESAITRCTNLCADSGVALVFVPELKDTRLCGAARWLSKDKALIQLSLRHKSDDHLWFTFYHEAAHILLHGKKELFIDEEEQTKDEQENEADIFAQNTLIPKDDWKNLMQWSEFTDSIIQSFAKDIGIAPGIVVGRLQFQEKLLSPKAKQNSLKVRYEWDQNGTKIFRKDKNASDKLCDV